MTCIRTGARVYFVNYGSCMSADIFAIAGAVVVRTTGDPTDRHDFPREKATHELTAPFGGQEEFWREDLGVFVVPANCLKELSA